MNITSPITTPVPQLPVQLDVTPTSPPQHSITGWGEPMDPPQPDHDTPPSAQEADQAPKVRNKRGISFFGRRFPFGGATRPTAPVSPTPSIKVPSPASVSPGPSTRVPPAPVNPTATRLQNALGGNNPGTSSTAASSSQSALDKLKGVVTRGPQTPTSGGVVSVKPVEPPKISVADVTQRLLDADRLVKAGVISTSPSTGKTIKDAFINAGVNGIVSAPINVGAYAGSVAAGEAIKGQYVPSPLPPPHLPGTAKPDPASTPQVAAPTTSDTPTPSATRHLDRVEKVVLEFANVIITLASGNTEDRLAMGDAWPKERGARLDNLEQLLSISETHMKQVAEDNGIIFKPHLEPETGPGTGGRLGVIERRYRALEKAADRIITLKDAEAKKTEASV
ncbi:hypothetical protein JJD73_06805 [Pseudomonas fluorescens]|nr:hypothetical protein [Pseudomonas fluorescens]MBK3481236.1 hypothetical protein [Pseudomonas fluorescens]